MKIQYTINELELRISNYLSGNCTDTEKEELFAFLTTDDKAAKVFQEMSSVWAMSTVPVFAKNEESNLIRIKERIFLSASVSPTKTPRKTVPVWLKVAATILLLLGCNYFWYTYTENLTETYTNAESAYVIKVPAGSRTAITLPDGTEVALNAGSVLSYDRGFGINKREVSLQGQGYFKVAKNKEKGFCVKTTDIQVWVTGTVFDVLAYDNERSVVVELIEGGVNLTDNHSNYLLGLKPSERAVYNRVDRKISKTKMKYGTVPEWTEEIISFYNESFSDIAKRLEREYCVRIVIESEVLKKECFSGSFVGKRSLDSILKEIDVERKFEFQFVGDTVFINDKSMNCGKKGGKKKNRK